MMNEKKEEEKRRMNCDEITNASQTHVGRQGNI